MLRTRFALVEQSRRLTLERGLHGFTVEELCAEIGISRRTFFNYFETKDDAVLGTTSREGFGPAGEDFVAQGSGPDSPTLLSALESLVLHEFRAMDSLPDMPLLVEVAQREPEIHERLTASMYRRVDTLAELIARRQGLRPEDEFPRLAAVLFVHLVGTTIHESTRLRGDGEGAAPVAEFLALFARHLELATALFSDGDLTARSRHEGTS